MKTHVKLDKSKDNSVKGFSRNVSRKATPSKKGSSKIRDKSEPKELKTPQKAEKVNN